MSQGMDRKRGPDREARGFAAGDVGRRVKYKIWRGSGGETTTERTAESG